MGSGKYISREDKTRDIKKALVHRARIRKNYFKLLDKEGIPIDKKGVDEVNGDEAKTKQNKPMNFSDRSKMVKQRKEENRKLELQKIQERKQEIAKKDNERIKKRERVEKKTSRGQPLMGPRINNLLDKIRKDM
jgi:hypothetical protein